MKMFVTAVCFLFLLKLKWPKDKRIQCYTQFKSPGAKILRVLHLHSNVTFTLKDIEIPGTKRFIPKGFDLGTKLS